MNVLCVKHGTKYGSEFVNKLSWMLKRNLTIPYQLYCYTDDPVGIQSDINIIPIPEDNDLEVWWNKLAMFKKGFGGLKGQCLYLDLDVVIQNNIDCLADYKDFTLIHAHWKGNITIDKYDMDINSSIITWEADSVNHIWEYFEKEKDFYMVKYRGIDRFLYHEGFKFNFFDRDLFYSRISGINHYGKPNDSVKVERTGYLNYCFYNPAALVCLMNGETSHEHYDRFKQLGLLPSCSTYSHQG